MRVYKILDAHWGMDDLKMKRIKLSMFNDMNDPFELYGVRVDDPSYPSWVRQLSKFGVLCFSKTWGNPVLWSHYGDKHRGICLGLEICEEDRAKAYPAQYTKNRRLIDFELSPHNTPNELNGLVRGMLLTKYKDWAYENEVRMFEPVDDSEKFSFKTLDNKLQLKEVILGARCSDETKEQIENLVVQYPGPPRVFRAQLAPDRFEMIEET